ncbi:MAG TPA: chromosomal replication initiator protein DnaA [Ktedonobacterales bacterium]|jgi:chromosomal replication initiator protein
MNAKQIWQAVLERIQGKMTQAAFNNTFSGTSGISLEGQVLRVRAGSNHAARTLNTRFKAPISRVLVDLLGPDAEVRFEVSREEVQPDGTLSSVIFYESEKAPPTQHFTGAVPRGSPTRARQQPLLPGSPVSQGSEMPGPRVTRPLVARPQLMPDADAAEVQAMSGASGFSIDETKVVDADPVAPVSASRSDGMPYLHAQAASAHERSGMAGAFFDGEDQPERPAPAVSAQHWPPWLQPAIAQQPLSAEPDKEARRFLSSAPIDGASSSLPPHVNGASQVPGASVEETSESNFPIYEQEPAARNERPEPGSRPTQQLEYLGPRNQASLPFPDDAGMLNPRYTFETFVVGQSNGFAYNAAQAVSKEVPQGMNPLFLHGGVGLGKTHLLHAIGHVVRARGLKVLYTTSENFTNEIINAIRFHSTAQFREKYRQLDMLMVDDIQLIAGKEATEEEFFNTFNVLHLANKQIVLSSDRSPAEIVKLHERLRSRLAWGIQPEIHKPEYELRVAILRFKAQQADLKLSDPIIELFARPECESVRELESIIARLLLYSQTEKRGITMALALEIFEAWQTSKKKGVFDLSVVLKVMAEKYEITVADLLSPRRDRRFAWPRQILMYLLRERARMRFEQVGEAIGGRDHTTVMHAVDQVNKRKEKDAEFGPQLMALWLEIEENFPRR